MARYKATVNTERPQKDAFEYMADFANSQEWDPTVLRTERLSEDPLGRGARFGLLVAFLGRKIELEYETVEVEVPDRVVLRAESNSVVSVDEMTFQTLESGGTALTYDANLQLKGALRVLDPLLRLAFNRVGDKARDGIARRLSRPRTAPDVSGDAPQGASATSGSQTGE